MKRIKILTRLTTPLLSRRGRGWVSLFLCLFVSLASQAQDVIEYPDISYAGTPRTLILGGINISGMEGYEE